jgi:hypothetical protein
MALVNTVLGQKCHSVSRCAPRAIISDLIMKYAPVTSHILDVGWFWAGLLERRGLRTCGVRFRWVGQRLAAIPLRCSSFSKRGTRPAGLVQSSWAAVCQSLPVR